jgi:chromosome segregation ATPase
MVQALRSEVDKRSRTIEAMVAQKLQDDEAMTTLKQELAFKQSRIERLEEERERMSSQYVRQMEEINSQAHRNLDLVTIDMQQQIETLRAERDKATATAKDSVRHVDMLKKTEIDLQAHIVDMEGQLVKKDVELVEKERKERQLRDQLETALAQRDSEAEVLEELEALKKKHHEYTAKTTNALRALSTDLTLVTTERDKLQKMLDVRPCRIRPCFCACASHSVHDQTCRMHVHFLYACRRICANTIDG